MSPPLDAILWMKLGSCFLFPLLFLCAGKQKQQQQKKTLGSWTTRCCVSFLFFSEIIEVRIILFQSADIFGRMWHLKKNMHLVFSEYFLWYDHLSAGMANNRSLDWQSAVEWRPVSVFHRQPWLYLYVITLIKLTDFY